MLPRHHLPTRNSVMMVAVTVVSIAVEAVVVAADFAVAAPETR